jgi:molecular chaperone DnaJ
LFGMTHANPYTILGLPTGADTDAARTAFRRVAMDCHPDRAPGDAGARHRFEEARAAYSRILAARRAMERMDQLRAGTAPSSAPPMAKPVPPRVRHPVSTTFVNLDLSPREAITGALKRVRGPDGSVVVRVPKGARDGDRLRGGDLLVLTVRINAKDGYQAIDNHIYGSIQIASDLAAAGGRTEVETPHGKLSLTIPAKLPDGARLRLANRGLPARGNKITGDLFLTVNIQAPSKSAFGKLLDAFGLRGPNARAAA